MCLPFIITRTGRDQMGNSHIYNSKTKKKQKKTSTKHKKRVRHFFWFCHTNQIVEYGLLFFFFFFLLLSIPSGRRRYPRNDWYVHRTAYTFHFRTIHSPTRYRCCVLVRISDTGQTFLFSDHHKRFRFLF